MDELQKPRSRRRPLLQSANGEVSIEHKGTHATTLNRHPDHQRHAMGVPRG